MHRILSRQTVSISELKKNPAAVIEAADGEAVAILVHNRPSAYLVPADTYERMLDRLEDAELAAIVRSRKTERTVKVKLDEL
jgi:antitoxin StbD